MTWKPPPGRDERPTPPALDGLTEPDVAMVTSRPPQDSFSGPLPQPPRGPAVTAPLVLPTPPTLPPPPERREELTPTPPPEEVTDGSVTRVRPAPAGPPRRSEPVPPSLPPRARPALPRRPSMAAMRNAGIATLHRRRVLPWLAGAAALVLAAGGVYWKVQDERRFDETRAGIVRGQVLDTPAGYDEMARALESARRQRPGRELQRLEADLLALAAVRTGRPEHVQGARAALAELAAARRPSAPAEALLGIATGEPRNALAVAQAALKSEERTPLLHFAAGLAAVRAGQFEEAQLALDAALQLDPRMIAAQLERARLMRRRGRYEEARAGLGAGTTHPLVQLELALLELVDPRDRDGAARALEQALAAVSAQAAGSPVWQAQAAHARGRLALMRSDLEAARAELRAAIELLDESEYHVAAGRVELLPGGDAQRAFDRLSQAVQRDGSPETRLALADAALRVGLPDEAIKAVDELRALPAARQAELSNLRLAAKAEEDDEAFVDAVCMNTIKQERPDDQTLLLCADARPSAGYAEKALQAVTRRDLKPVAEGVLALRRGEAARAEELLAAAAQGPSASTPALLSLARAQLDQEQYVQAVATLRRATQIDGSSRRSRLWLAYALGAAGRLQEARQMFADDLGQRSTSVRLRKTLAALALALGELRVARGAVEQAATLQNPPSAGVLALQARASMAEGDYERAHRELGYAFKRDSEHPDVAGAALELELRRKDRDGIRMIQEKLFAPRQGEALFEAARRTAFRAAGQRPPDVKGKPSAAGTPARAKAANNKKKRAKR